MIEEEADLILVAPLFPTQTWFPHVLKLVLGDSFILPKVDHLLYLPKQGKVHNLTSMRMVVFRLSGNNSHVQEYQQKLQPSFVHHGDQVLQNNMGHISKKWVHFCSEQQIDAIYPSLNEILTFLTHLSSSNLGYSSINSAKSMLSSLFSLLYKRDIGTEPLIRHFMKGIFNMKPSLPRYVNTWDVQTVITYLDSLNTLEVSLKLLSVKLTTVLALTTGQRCQTLWAIQVNDIEISKEFMKVRISKLLKQSKVNNHLREMYFEPFVKNSNICVIQCMKTYLAKTQELRKISSAENLFIITQKPYNSATKSTISRRIKLALKWADIDIKTFSTHSTRSASTSAVLGKNPIDTILKTAGWSKDSTFRMFYNRPVSNSSEFSHAVLNA